jgi:hypothetical protein
MYRQHMGRQATTEEESDEVSALCEAIVIPFYISANGHDPANVTMKFVYLCYL